MSKKQTPQTNKRYTAEFKSEAIKLAERLGVAEAAEKLGIYPSQIYSWRSALSNSRTGVERESLLATENARLKRQLAEQAEELEILKKAATYFAKHQK
jgi:transposase